MSRSVCWLIVALLFGGFAAVAAHALAARAGAGKGMPPFSVYSAERDGLARAGEFLRRCGYQPVAVTRPIQHTRHSGLLILVVPPAAGLPGRSRGEIDKADARGLLAWVEQGNTLLVFGDRPNAVYAELGITTVGEAAPAPAAANATPEPVGRYTQDLESLRVSRGPGLEAPGSLPLWRIRDRAGALAVRRGKGRVLAVADPYFLTPAELRRDRLDNGVFLNNVASLAADGGRVYFDEYHQGLRSAGGFWGYLHYHKQHGLFLDVLLVTLIGLWAVGVRLGPAVPTRTARRYDAVEYASALARVYRQAGVRRRPAQVLVRDFLSGLTHHLGLRRGALPVEILVAWRKRHHGAPGPTDGEADQRGVGFASHLGELLRGVAELRKGEASPRRLLAWAQAFDRFQAEVLRARRDHPVRPRTGRVPARPR